MPNVHVSNNSGNNEWYTPLVYIEAARKVMGSINVDPASNDIAQSLIKADKYYTYETDGLSKDWHGNVWLNPPYSGKLIKSFIFKLTEEVSLQNCKQFCVLVNNATETEWFSNLSNISDSICFIKKRIKFLDSSLKPSKSPLQGQVVFYRGNNVDDFIKTFSEFGQVLMFLKVAE